MNNKKKENKSGKTGIWIAVALLIIGLLDSGTGIAFTLFPLLILFGIFALVGKMSKKARENAAKNAEETPVYTAPKQTSAKPARPAKSAPASPAQERKYYDSTCMTDCSQHDHNRRIEQLNDFLRDGIIDREEYKILLARYEEYR